MRLKTFEILAKRPDKLLILFLEYFAFMFPDKMYLKIQFYLRMGYPLNLDKPRSLSEKIQWLKLYNRNPLYTSLVDKYEVKRIVAEKIGSEHIIPTIKVWDNADMIDWESLPKCFVLKTTHGGGNYGVVICKDLDAFNKADAVARLKRAYKQNIYQTLREWPYKNLKKRILAEQLMVQNDGTGLVDYKFFCFNGQPRYLYLSQYQRDGGAVKNISCFLSLDWELLPYRWKDEPIQTELPPKPRNLEEMISVAQKLSEQLPLVRVDLYSINDKVYFSELTFYPSSGLNPYDLREWDYELGDLLILPSKNC